MPFILLPPFFGGDKRGGMCYNPHRNANFGMVPLDVMVERVVCGS